MSTESLVVPKVEEYLKSKGWRISREVKVRGRIIDILGVKDDKIIAIEVKGSVGNIESGIEQALHQKRAANFSYLAIPEERVTDSLIETCKNLGIGLMLLNDRVKEVVKPAHSKALTSVKKKILGIKPEKRRKMTVKSLLEHLFRSRGQILILKLFFLNPNKEFHLNDIARRTGLSPSYVVKELDKIEKIGLVSRREQGNLVLFKADRKNVIYDELKKIFLKYELLDEIVARELPTEQIKYAFIYGSFAQGKEIEASDIDLFVVGKIKENAILNVIRKVESETGREVNYILWTEEEFRKKVKENVPLLRNIVDNPVIMIVGEEDEFRRAVKQ